VVNDDNGDGQEAAAKVSSGSGVVVEIV